MATSDPPPNEAAADRLVDDDILKVVWREIGLKWRELARELQITDSKLDNIFHQYNTQGGLPEVAYQMLRAWREAASTNARISVLTAGLEQAERTDLVHKIITMVQIPKADNRRRNQGEELPTSETDRQVDNGILRAVCCDIGAKWRDLGRLLLVSDSKLDDIFQQCHTQGGLPELAYQMLLAWREAASTNASLSALTAHLIEIGRLDIADKILKMPPESSNGNRYPNQSQELLEDEWLKWLRNKLCNKFEAYVMKGLPWMGNISTSLADYYVDLTVQTDDSDNARMPSNRREGHSFTGARIKKKLRSFFGRNQKDANDVFQSAFSSHKRPLRVLVEGPPGYGKTTLSAKLCFDHAASADYMKNFDLVLHYPLRSFEGNLEDMLCRAADLSDSHEREMFLGILNNPSTRILLVLDGFDEVPQQHVKLILDFLQGQLFPHVYVVVTSRPGHFTFERWERENDECAAQYEFTRDWNRLWQSRITILGINKKMKALFIKKHLARFPKNIKRQVSSQLQQLEENKIIEPKFLECPLFLLMLILLVTGEETGGIRNLRTPTDLHKSVFNFIIQRYCSKQNEPINEKVDLFTVREVPKKPFYVDLLCQFGEFALWALTEKKLSFIQEEILGSSQQRDARILELGLLTQSVSTVGWREKVVYQLVHKSLLEFSAAYALWQQFPPQGDRSSWARKVARLWGSNPSEPFCLIMLTGLMRDSFLDFLDALNPYANCEVWKWLRPSMSEIDLTKSVLSSFTPFLPTHWEKEDVDCFSRTQHDTLLLHGIRHGRIKRVRLRGFLATPMPDDVVVDTAVFMDIEHTVVNVHKFNCRRLVFWNSYVSRGLDTWIPSTINFQTLSFDFVWYVSFQLRLLRRAIMAGALKDIQIQITCRIRETADVVALTKLIKMEKLMALYLYDTPSGSNELNGLLRAAANSSQLTTLFLGASKGVSVDLCYLCGGVQKTWQLLSITNCEIDFPLQTDQTFQVNCLVLDCPFSPAVLLFLEVCQVSSLQCKLPLLTHIETLPLLPEHLTELNVILDKTIVDAQQCRLPHLPNLTVLIFTITEDGPHYFAVRDFLFGSRSFLRLKGIEIWGAGWNKEFVKCVFDCLKQSIHVPTRQGTLRSSHSLQLEYFLLQSDKTCQKFSAPLRDMAAYLRNKALSRLDIVRDGYLSPRLFDVFSTAAGFRMEMGGWGTRSEDTILSRMKHNTQYESVFNCYSIRHTH